MMTMKPLEILRWAWELRNLCISLSLYFLIVVMLRHILLLVLASSVTHAARVDIKFTRNPQELTLTLKEHFTTTEGAVVSFHYFIGQTENIDFAKRTPEGFQFITRDINLDGLDSISAYANIYNTLGHLVHTTKTAVLDLKDSNTAVALPSRQIRAAVIFRDDFDSLDLTNWIPEVSMYGGMNWEFQVYTSDQKNVFVKNGQLYLKPTLTVDDPRFDENFLRTGTMNVTELWGSCTNAARNGCVRNGQGSILPTIMSGKLRSVPAMRYGTVEVRARIPKGDWIWPAIWMLPRDEKYGGWPRSGEIDIMESRGNGGDYGIGSVLSTLHWGPNWEQNRYMLTHGQRHRPTWHDDFHIWRLEWTPEHIVTYVDDQLLLDIRPPSGGFWEKGGFRGENIWESSKMAPFDQEFYMIFNVAVGGTNGFFPDKDIYPTTKPWKNDSPNAPVEFWEAKDQWYPSWEGDKAALIIDYIEMKSL